MNTRFGFLVMLLIFFGIHSPAYAQALGEATCGRLQPEGSNIEGYGPWDYSNPEHRAQKLSIVEQHHFNRDVEQLRKGITTAPAAPDLNYTLWAFPNHHRALVSLINLALREKTNRPRHMSYSVECLFDRAMRFKPSDKRVPMLYGFYLMKTNKPKEALKFFSAAEEGLNYDPNFHYNFGLLYAELQQWDKAVDQAAAAYGAGFTLPGLRNKLVNAGKWDAVEKKLTSGKVVADVKPAQSTVDTADMKASQNTGVAEQAP